ncbi:hypothetical protein [Anaeroselena agilis]|uniref:Uncharacterized protein n=1 Tax=Anaeroselena agilis TaxID=3063788 RepID=A0ABU3NZG6_9FIRM|nr:hypothetical protein [Selenomonadales bacterium 4137-cl]
MSKLWTQFNEQRQVISPPQTKDPWPSPWVSDAVKEQYCQMGWEQVEEADIPSLVFYVPPIPQDQQIAALNAEFDVQRRLLLEYITTADKVYNDQVTVAELVGEFTLLEEEYQIRMGVILNGGSS